LRFLRSVLFFSCIDAIKEESIAFRLELYARPMPAEAAILRQCPYALGLFLVMQAPGGINGVRGVHGNASLSAAARHNFPLRS
jgi:hypothetical protein